MKINRISGEKVQCKNDCFLSVTHQQHNKAKV